MTDIVKLMMTMGINLVYAMLCLILYIVVLKIYEKFVTSTDVIYRSAIAIGVAIVIGLACN